LPGVQEASMRNWATAGQRIMEPGMPLRSSSGHNPAVTRCECGSGLVCYDRETDRCSYVCQGPLGSGSAKRSMICSARCSALVRDRPVVVMTLWWPRRSRMSQVRPGGRPRELVEPVSIWTVTGGTAGRLSRVERMALRLSAIMKLGSEAGCWVRTRQGGATPGWRAGSY
jgi:hypothetical protein